MGTERYVATVDSLGVHEFPEPIESLLDDLAWDEVSTAGLERVVEHHLGLEYLPAYFWTVMKTRHWGDVLDRQLFGTVCTFLWAEQTLDVEYDALGRESGRYVRFVVDELENGRELSLVYPGYKNRFDYDVRVDDWYRDHSVAQSPRHWHLFSDFFWKYKQTRSIESNTSAASSLAIAVEEIYRRANPEAMLQPFEPTPFEVGRNLEVLFGILPWFFMEEDINYTYAGADGKAMPFDVLAGISKLRSDDFTTVSGSHCPYSDGDADRRHTEYHEIMAGLANYEATLQDNCTIVETVHRIADSCPRGPGR